MRIDHVAYPCTNPSATTRFYTEVLGLPLVEAYAGPILVFGLPDGGSLVFTAHDEPLRDDGVAWEKRHVGLMVATRGEFERFLQRLREHGVRHQLVDDERIYFVDPDGLVLEIEVG